MTNVDIARSIYAAIAVGDLDAAMACFAPDAEWQQTTAVPDRATYRGREQIAEFLRELLDSFSFAVEIERYIDADEHVAAIGFVRGRASTTTIPIRLAFVHIFQLLDGKVVSVFDCAGTAREP
jgi:ketosteroid isomerase-like protein